MGDRDHLLGIGGVGMSALAQALIDAGRTVTGADRLVDGGGTTPVLEALRRQGVKLFPETGAGIDSGTSRVIASTAIEDSNLGLVRAVEKFDPAKGAKFSSYAAWWIKQSMRRALANQASVIRIPVQSAGKINKIKLANMKLTEQLGRAPTDNELADNLSLSERTVAALRLSDLKTIHPNTVKINVNNICPVSFKVGK